MNFNLLNVILKVKMPKFIGTDRIIWHGFSRMYKVTTNLNFQTIFIFILIHNSIFYKTNNTPRFSQKK